jgi:hypothetical protein
LFSSERLGSTDPNNNNQVSFSPLCCLKVFLKDHYSLCL